MSIDSYFDEMKKIQNKMLEYLDSEAENDDEYVNFKVIFERNQIHSKKHELKSVLYLLLQISNKIIVHLVFRKNYQNFGLFQG